MPFVAPAIAAAVGGGIVTEIAVGLGMSLALGAASRALAPSPKANSAGGMRLSLRTTDNSPRLWSVGRLADAGELKYHHVFGPNGNDSLQMVFQVADHECDGLETVYINGVAVDWNSGTGAVAEYPGMTITWHGGAPGQTADANLVAASGGRWTTDDVGSGLAYVVVEMAYSPTTYPNGLPKFLFVFRGAKMYDIRKDSTAGGSGAHRWGVPSTYEWSDNAALAAYTYLRGVWSGSQRLIGMNTPASALPAADWIAAANVCDESVALKGGGTEKRYRIGGVLSSAVVHRENIDDLKRACAGLFVETGGTFKLRPGAARTVVATITDDDLLDDAEVTITPKRPRSQLVNAVFGSYSEPAQQFETIALPPRLSPDDEAADGGIRLEEHYALDLVTSGPQGQRVLEILRRRARHQRQVRVRLPSSLALLEAGDWIEWNSDRYGWTGYFEARSIQVGADLTVSADLQEVSTGIFAWSTGDELDPLAPATLPSGGPTVNAISGLAVETTSITNGAVTRPGLHATWTPVTDASVVSMRLQYRIQGDTVALDVAVLQPSLGGHTWITGVQGASGYEIRALPVCRPERAVDWTAWKQTAVVTAGQAVATAITTTSVTSVAADTVTPAMLSPQARRELELTTGLATLQGSVSDQIERMRTESQRVAETAVLLHARAAEIASGIRVERITRETAEFALSQQITTIAAEIGAARAGILVEETARVDSDTALANRITALVATVTAGAVTTDAAIVAEQNARASADTALASDITTLSSTVSGNYGTLSAQISSEASTRASADAANASSISTVSTTVSGHTSSITTMNTSINGIRSTWTVSLTGGYATGWAMLDGSGTLSTFGVLADKFFVAQPGVTGGTARQVFTIGTIGGVSAIGIAGNVIVDGTITAQKMNVVSLDAIAADIGVITAGRLQNTANTTFIDLDSGDFQFGAP